ncbi:phosphocholine cytidylyltransferase family protein [Flindersiella endophytica]
MIGVVLAAGTGRRLQPFTDTLPKALVPVPTEGPAGAAETTPLDVILGNFAEIGLTDVAIVVGYAAEAVEQRKAALQDRYGLNLELIHNDRATTWNNCYSLWCARDLFGQDVLLSNGDTIHPVSVEHDLLGNTGPALVLAVDNAKRLGEEEMKLLYSGEHGVTRITKLMDPGQAYGEYIGVAAIYAEVAAALADALRATWERDPGLYYEDGFQELIDRGDFRVEVQPIGEVPWIEIDDHADLARAAGVLRELSVRRQGV